MTAEPVRPRHARQARFRPLGADGQQRLSRGHAAVVGLGALGSVVAETLARAGVRRLTLIDRDVVEETNLQRQFLYTSDDARDATPKAHAARRELMRIDSELRIDAAVADLTPSNIQSLLGGAGVVVDGTDNFTTRYLLNDFSVEHHIPWVYGAAVGSAGLVMAILPGDTACLRCVFPEPTPPEETPNCETAGILASASGMVALAESAEAIKILSGRQHCVVRGLQHFDPWDGEYRTLQCERDPRCPCCALGDRSWLRGTYSNSTVTLCGRNSVQVTAPRSVTLDLAAFAARVPNANSNNPFSLRFEADGRTIILFRDGRAIVGGTSDPAVARSIYSRYVGD